MSKKTNINDNDIKKGTGAWKICGYVIQHFSDMIYCNPEAQNDPIKPQNVTAEQAFESVLELLDCGILFLCSEKNESGEDGLTIHTKAWFEEEGVPIPQSSKKYRKLFSGHYNDWA